jgi:hypothetical protein
MLGPPFQVRARSAIAPPGSVSIRSGAVDFIDAVMRGLSDVALVDPMLAERDRRVPDSLLRAHLGTVLYIRLTPEYAQASMGLIRELGSGEIVTYGYNDDPRTFAEILRRQSRASRGQLLLHALAPQIAALPSELRRGIASMSEQGHRIDSVDRLAMLCSVTPSTLFRHFKNAGITSTSRFVAGFIFLRNYDALVDTNLTTLDVARAVGLSSERSLQQRSLALTGLSLREIRTPISIEHLAQCMANGLTAT